MAGGFRTHKTGDDAVVARIKAIERKLAKLTSPGNVNNSTITGGAGLTVGKPGGPQINLHVDPSDGEGAIRFSADGFVTDGVISCVDQWDLSITSPFPAGTPGLSAAFLDLISDNGSGAQINLQAGGNLGVQLIGPVGATPASTSVEGVQFVQDGSSTRMMTGSGSLVFPASTAECRVRSFDDSAYEPIRASAFTVSSTRQAKQNIRPLGWDPVEIVQAAKAQAYNYRPEHADPQRFHVGPMIEDLPEELIDRSDPDTPAVDVMALVGVLWAAVGQLAAQVAELQS